MGGGSGGSRSARSYIVRPRVRRQRKLVVPLRSIPPGDGVPHTIKQVSLGHVTGEKRQKQAIHFWTDIGNVLHGSYVGWMIPHNILPYALRLKIFKAEDVVGYKGKRIFGPGAVFDHYINKSSPFRGKYFEQCDKFRTFEEDGKTWYDLQEAIDQRPDETEGDKTPHSLLLDHDIEQISNLPKGVRVQHDLVVLTSGGYDSTLLLHMAKKMGYKPISLLINYGQKHIRELESAVRLCDRLKVPYRRMSVTLNGVDSGLTGSLQESMYAGAHSHHVPGRNTIFVGMALSLAESVGATKIWHGANMEDRINQFPDCSQEFVYSMNQTVCKGASYPIEFEAPLLGMRKDTIIRLGKAYHEINEEDVHSGYAV